MTELRSIFSPRNSRPGLIGPGAVPRSASGSRPALRGELPDPELRLFDRRVVAVANTPPRRGNRPLSLHRRGWLSKDPR